MPLFLSDEFQVNQIRIINQESEDNPNFTSQLENLLKKGSRNFF